jgi:hypothetical protein
MESVDTDDVDAFLWIDGLSSSSHELVLCLMDFPHRHHAFIAPALFGT